MRLPEAIRTGAQQMPQVYQDFFTPVETETGDSTWGCCVLGAVLVTLGVTPEAYYNGDLTRGSIDMLEEAYPCLADRFDDEGTLMSAIVTWNDGWRMTREEIADKLERMGYE